MRRAITPLLVCLAVPLFAATPPDRLVTFRGEVTEGQTFRQSIGPGLDFVLMPDASGSDSPGWTIEVSPQDKAGQSDCGDFVWVVTPPYHFENQRYLNTDYGVTAQEVVHRSPRRFNFVLNCADYETESKRVDLAIYGYNAPEHELDEARAKLGSSPLGEGRLWIEDWKITPGKSSGAHVDLGAIHWIKFKVEITYPVAASQHPKP